MTLPGYGLGITNLVARPTRAAAELDAIQMNPFNTGGGLEPAGFLNRLRDYAYPLSQAGWRKRQAGAPLTSRSSTATSSAGSGVAR